MARPPIDRLAGPFEYGLAQAAIILGVVNNPALLRTSRPQPAGMPLRLAALRLVWPLLGVIYLFALSGPAEYVHAGDVATVPPVTVGLLPVMVLAGQSNMIGLMTNVDDLPVDGRATQSSVLFYGPDENGSTWSWLTPPTVTNNR